MQKRRSGDCPLPPGVAYIYMWQTIGELGLDLCIHTCRDNCFSPAQTAQFTIVLCSRAVACQHLSPSSRCTAAFPKAFSKRGAGC
ncbi:hypothetical protein K523DRAFT_239988 [Schizophyllum commune Tattone D]|nr:hypothetical protein K523DRAFT_239988 [Schizophyllum commune Tattone D]